MEMVIQKVLVCGYGSIGKRHVRTFQKLIPGAKIAILRSNTKSTQNQSNYLEFIDIESALNWTPDCVIIANPAPFHVELALKSLRQSIPTFIEKPLGSGHESKENFIELLNLEQSVPVLVGYVLRHDAGVKILQEWLGQKLIGQVVEIDLYCGSWLPDWRQSTDYRDTVSASRSLGGGVLRELSHEIDLAHHLFGHLRLLFAHVKQSGLIQGDVEDQATIVAETEEGVCVSIRLNFCTTPTTRRLTIRGDRGQIVLDFADKNIILTTKNVKNVVSYAEDSESMYEDQMNHFISCCTKKASPACTVSDGIQVLKFIQDVENSVN